MLNNKTKAVLQFASLKQNHETFKASIHVALLCKIKEVHAESTASINRRLITRYFQNRNFQINEVL